MTNKYWIVTFFLREVYDRIQVFGANKMHYINETQYT